MRKQRIFLVMLAIGLVLGMTIVGCSNGTTTKVEEERPSGPPPSVSDYYSLEPQMAENPHRAVARTGGTTTIGIPSSIRSASRAGNETATFAIHEGDEGIAEIVSQNGTTCQIRGLQLGSARIIVTVDGRSATVIIAVTPSESLYTLPAASVKKLGNSTFYNAWWNNDKPDYLPSDVDDYTSEPTYQLAWNWRNPTGTGSSFGASSPNCGIDILAYYVDPEVENNRGWVRTTYGFGGWHYDLNGTTSKMTNGVQVNGDVKLELIPEFIYDNGVPYLQITHKLTNTGSTQLTEQKFGASADVMIYGNDHAPLIYLRYGALMTDETMSGGINYLAKIKYRLVCQNLQGVDDVSTLWLGRYPGERSHVYEDQRESITSSNSTDTALNFSYQNITLDPGQSKTYVIRFTQVQ